MTWASKCSTLALVAAMAAASPAQAQDAEGDEIAASQSNENQLTTIVVTAQRREASVQDTSAAISAFSGDALEENRTLSFEDLAGQATSLSFTALSRWTRNSTFAGSPIPASTRPLPTNRSGFSSMTSTWGVRACSISTCSTSIASK